MLTPVELPELGGDTMWASMSAAWEALSSHHQSLLEQIFVEFQLAALAAKGLSREPKRG